MLLIISKGKLYLLRTLTWLGLGIAILAIYAPIWGLGNGWAFLIFAGGLIACFCAAAQIDRLYSCPSCGKKLQTGSRLDALRGKYLPHCPHCGAKITIKIQ